VFSAQLIINKMEKLKNYTKSASDIQKNTMREIERERVKK